MEWLDRERPGLVAAVRQAAAADLDELCWDLALTVVSLFEVRGYVDDWRETAELAHATAVRNGNRLGTAAALYSRGSLAMFPKDLGEAQQLFSHALKIFESCGHTHGEALVLGDLAFI